MAFSSRSALIGGLHAPHTVAAIYAALWQSQPLSPDPDYV